MSFQFQCPQGHLLEAEETDVGKKCLCPYCGLTLAIPTPVGIVSSAPPTVMPATPPPAVAVVDPLLGSVPYPTVNAAPVPPPMVGRRRRAPLEASGEELDFGAGGKREAEAVNVKEKEKLFHIACPNGHELEVPHEMLDQTALCPHCNSKFTLRERASVEFQRKKVIREEQKERSVSTAWLNWVVGISVVVMLFLLGLALL
jgi:DNA-directed RNA polymerase subunit RPC12/RpoP